MTSLVFVTLALALTGTATGNATTLVATTPITTARTIQHAVADSATDTLLTSEQLTRYIGVKKALEPFWRDSAHAALLKTAKSTGHQPMIRVGPMETKIGVFDYPALVKQDAGLAAIFTTNHFAPEQFEATQITVFTALGTLAIAEATMAALPATTTTLGKNVELVKAHREELAAVGVALQVQTSDARNDGLKL